MKIQKNIALVALMLGALLALSGCASMDAPNQASLMAAAGFRTVVPETAKQKELYAAAEPYKVLTINVKGKLLYAYKDERKGVAYIGGPSEYQRYQALAVQQGIAQQYQMAAAMNASSAYGWYGAYGPYYGGIRPVPIRPMPHPRIR